MTASLTKLRPGILYIDTAVGSKEFESLLHQRHGVKVAVVPLRYSTGGSADFAFLTASNFMGLTEPSRIAIERKTLSDMQGSLLRNRFAKQVCGMLTDYQLAWLVVEGLWRNGDDDAIETPRYIDGKLRWVQDQHSSLTYSQLSSWLTRYDVAGGGRIHRWRTSTRHETAAWIASTFRWCNKDWKKHQLFTIEKMQPAQKALLFKPKEEDRVAAAFDRIGTKKMRMVVRHFESIIEMINASEDEWVATGIGKAAAAHMWTAIRRKYQ